jgi:hypothetical protein
MEPRTYRIVVRGQLSERFAGAFDGMVVQPRAASHHLRR